MIAEWGVLENNTAVIEMASAAGIILLGGKPFDPLITSTYGVGQLIKEAVGCGIRNFIIGIGGSATNDGGAGMLEALGFEFLDADGNPIPRGAAGLSKLRTISDAHADPLLKDCTFRIVCDVQNPLCGPNGCSRVFGPQKGATEAQIVQMDAWLRNYAVISGGDPDAPGAGAAGGLGYAFMTFLNSSLERGIDVVIEATGLESHIAEADLVITGEGRIDSQTVMGKAPSGVAALAKRYNKKVIAFCGIATEDSNVCCDQGIDVICPIKSDSITIEEAMKKDVASENLVAAAEQIIRRLISEGDLL